MKESNYKEIVEYNRKLLNAGLVEELVENTDWEPVLKFFSEVGSKGKEILDIGCATGSLAARLRTENYRWQSYRGVDILKEYVDKFNSRGIPDASAEVGNATNLNTQRDCSMDVIILLFVLQHLCKLDGMKALRELRRVAKPGADVLIGLTVNPIQIEERKRYVSKKAKELAGVEDVWTLIWNQDEFMKCLRDLDLDILDCEEIQGKEIPGTGKNYLRLYIRAHVTK